VILRALGPIFAGELQGDTDVLKLKTVIPDLNDVARIHLGSISGVVAGDTLHVMNLRTGEAGCGYITDEGRVRAVVACDVGDPISATVYRGHAMVPEPGCPLRDDAEVVGVLDTFEDTIQFQGQQYGAGEPLVSLAEGLGKQRATPGLRRFLNLAQHVLDPADPGVLTELMLRRPFTYKGTGQTTGAHMMAVTTLGDMNVPASGGINLARSAGLVNFLDDDPRWGKSQNQVMIETGVFEAVHTLERYHDSDGNPVHLDVENFSDGTDLWLDTYPRLAEPFHFWGEDAFCSDEPPYDTLDCGVSGLILPLTSTTGKHGFDFPGDWTEKGRNGCKSACEETATDETPDPCDCENLEVFDIGYFVFNTLGRYFTSGGAEWNVDPCNALDTCEDLPPRLDWRDDLDPALK
jgi:hypothetical protein